MMTSQNSFREGEGIDGQLKRRAQPRRLGCRCLRIPASQRRHESCKWRTRSMVDDLA